MSAKNRSSAKRGTPKYMEIMVGFVCAEGTNRTNTIQQNAKRKAALAAGVASQGEPVVTTIRSPPSPSVAASIFAQILPSTFQPVPEPEPKVARETTHNTSTASVDRPRPYTFGIYLSNSPPYQRTNGTPSGSDSFHRVHRIFPCINGSYRSNDRQVQRRPSWGCASKPGVKVMCTLLSI